jgi:predicted HTH domain antitoxin
MTLEIPDSPAPRQMPPEALRLELACALYARGKIGKAGGAELAGVDFFAFQGALHERGVEHYTREMVEQDAAALRKFFPK